MHLLLIKIPTLDCLLVLDLTKAISLLFSGLWQLYLLSGFVMGYRFSLLEKEENFFILNFINKTEIL